MGWRGRHTGVCQGKAEESTGAAAQPVGVAGKCDLPRVLREPLKGQWVWRGEDEGVGGYGTPAPKPGWGQHVSRESAL